MANKPGQIYLFIFVIFSFLWNQQTNYLTQKSLIEKAYHDKVDYWRFSKDYFNLKLGGFVLNTITHMGGRLSTIVNTLQRPCGRLTLRYFIYKIIGFLIAIIAIRLDIKDSFPIGYGIFAEKKINSHIP